MSSRVFFFTKSTWKVRNVLRYDKLNLVKSFLFTLASRRSYLRLDKRCSRSETSCSIRVEFRSQQHRDTFRPGHFAIIRLPNGRRLIRAFDRISENLCFSYLPNLTDFRSYYCYPKRNRTVKPLKRKLLMTLIMCVYAHTHAHPYTYGLRFTPDIYQPLD